MPGVLIFVLVISSIVIIVSIAKMVTAVREVTKENQDRYENARRNWDKRAKEVGFSAAGKSIVYRKYSNTDKFYPVYVWIENGTLWEFIAEPTQETCGDSMYTYPENMKKVYKENLRRIYRTGSQGSYIEKDFSHADGLKKRADESTGLKRLYYRKESLDATINAPSHIVEYDNRLTILEGDNYSIKYRIDAYDVFKRLVPDKC